MATKVYESETMLIGDVEVNLRPLKIANLRTFMTEWGKLLENLTDNEKSMDTMTNCVIIALKQWEPTVAKKAVVEKELDMEDYHRIFKIGAGIDLDAVGNLEAAGLAGTI